MSTGTIETEDDLSQQNGIGPYAEEFRDRKGTSWKTIWQAKRVTRLSNGPGI